MDNPSPLDQPAPPMPGMGAPERRSTTRAARIGWTIAACTGVLAIAGGALLHVSANTGFDDAAARLDVARAAAADAGAALREASDESLDEATVADSIVSTATDDLVDPTARLTLADAVGEAKGVVAAADEALSAPVGEAEDKPFWTWEILGLTPEIDRRADQAAEIAAAMDEMDTELATIDETLVDAATDLFATVPAAAAALEAANISAQAVLVLDFRDAAEAAAGQDRLGSGAASAFTTLAETARTLKASQATELAEKQGPLLATRLEIEEYARSIAGGVVLDFDWQQTVAGTGGSQGIGGTATWNTIRGGFSTITLSHSVAEWWPNADSRALVAHEVGHSITSKCWEKFDHESQAANEEWATAWAISMGHTAQGNGVQAYGYPSQAMIDIAATCR